MMRIGVLIDTISVGGVEKVAIREVQALRILGEDAVLLVLRRNPREGDEYKELLGDIPVIYLDDFLPRVLRFSFKFPLFAFFSFFHISYAILIPLVIKKDICDYIISHASYTTFTSFMLRKLKGIPYSIFFWDPIDYILKRVYSRRIPYSIHVVFSILGRELDRYLAGNADGVFIGSKAHKQYFIDLVGKDRLHIIPPATYLGKPSQNKKDYVVTLTAWKKGKNPEYLFKIIKKIPDLKIKMIGRWMEPKLLKEFKKNMTKEGFDENIEILGYVPEKDLKTYYQEALVSLTTNLEKGFGMPVLEAASWGTTFIVPKGSGVCDVFKNGTDGFFTREKDTDEIVERITELLNNRDKAVKMGLHAYETAKKAFTWQAHAEKLKNVIYSTL